VPKTRVTWAHLRVPGRVLVLTVGEFGEYLVGVLTAVPNDIRPVGCPHCSGHIMRQVVRVARAATLRASRAQSRTPFRLAARTRIPCAVPHGLGGPDASTSMVTRVQRVQLAKPAQAVQHETASGHATSRRYWIGMSCTRRRQADSFPVQPSEDVQREVREDRDCG
jgi:hypothetical protein